MGDYEEDLQSQVKSESLESRRQLIQLKQENRQLSAHLKNIVEISSKEQMSE